MSRRQYTTRTGSHRASGRKFRWSKQTILLSVILITAIVLGVLELTNTTHLFHKGKPASEVVTKVGTASQPPRQNVSANNPTPKKNGAGGSGAVIQGGATDTNGQTTATTSSSQWVTSKSGNITVKQPVADSTLKNGDYLVGTAKVTSVNYRLIDNSAGVIATGTLSVVNGKFSGILHFSSQANSGRLDVFSTGANGIELNEIQISVSF